MKIALKQAEKAFNLCEVPIGAVVVKNNEIISTAYNQKEKRNSCLAHAEILAIAKASKKLNNWRLNGCVIYVTLEPCPMCASAIQQSRICKVVYGASSGFPQHTQLMEGLFSIKNANKKVILTAGVLENECSLLLKKFFDQKR